MYHPFPTGARPFVKNIFIPKIENIGRDCNGYISAFRGKAMCGCSIQANRQTQKQMKKERRVMSNSNSNKIMVPNAREAMNKFKMEAANDLAVSAPS